MTSKEALERLGAEKLARGELIRNDSKVEPYIECINKDLERLEALEKEKEYLKTTNEALNEMLLQASNEAIKLETENEKLKDSIQIKQKQVNECIDTLTQENEKLKKVIQNFIEWVEKQLEQIEQIKELIPILLNCQS